MQIHNSFIVAETDEGLSIFDQHALHERILLQKMRRDLEAGQIEQQSLLLPHLVEMSPGEVVVLMDMADDLKATGFDVEDHGDGVLAVSALPAALSPGRLESFFEDLVEAADGLAEPSAIRERAVALCACRSAIKAGDALESSEIEALLRDFLVEDYTFACEHGRPTHVRIPLSELARGFTRH